MRINKIFKEIIIDEYSSTPKYLQLFNFITKAIQDGHLKRNEILPSINELSYILEISRDTAEKSYKHLKEKEIIKSVPGKGFYVGKKDLKKALRIFLLFNKLSAHKKIIYDTFVKSLGEDVAIDFYIYNNDFTIFKKLIQSKKDEYTHYVIIPHFVEGGEFAHNIINTIPKQKLIILDKKIRGIEGKYSAIYENFEKDIYEALSAARGALEKYHTLKMVFPKRSYFPKEIIKGFKAFCQQYAFSCFIVHEILNEPINAGEVYINLMEDDLVVLIERILALDLKIGKDVGVISYNETPLKKLLLNGITTVSTDFKGMGLMAAEMIKNNEIAHKELSFKLTLRSSL